MRTTPEASNGELLDTGPAAAVIGVEPNTLCIWRMTGRHGLPFIKVGRRVKYRRADLERWLAERTGTSTAQIAAAIA